MALHPPVNGGRRSVSQTLLVGTRLPNRAKPTIPQKVTSVEKRARAAPDKDGGAAQARIIAHAKGRDPVGLRPGKVLVGGSPGGFGQLRPSPSHLGSGETLAPCVLEPGRSA